MSIETRLHAVEEYLKVFGSQTDERTVRDFGYIQNADANALTETGLYHVEGTLANFPSTNLGIVYTEWGGTPFQLYFPDATNALFKRKYNNNTNSWLSWEDMSAANPKEYNWNQFTYSSGFTYYANDEGGANTPKAYKAGRCVSLFGAYRTTAAQTSTGEKLMGYVPAGCEPIHTIQSIQQGSGQARYLLTIHSNGQMYASRYGTTSDTAIINWAWLNISVSYISKA